MITPGVAAGDLGYLAPELVLLGAAVVSLLFHAFFPRRGRILAGAAALAGTAAALAVLVSGAPASVTIFSGNLVVDPFGVFFRTVVLLATALSLILSFRFFRAERNEPGELYSLVLMAATGMMISSAATDLVTTYVSFELFAITSYVLAGIFKGEKRSAEAGIKYFFLGTLSSGIMLLGMAVLFGLTGETAYRGIAAALGEADARVALLAMVLFFSGMFFKAAFVPFHMWTPDVYEGAPTPVTVFLSTASKAAVLAVLVRAMTSLFGRFEAEWTSVFLVLALLTMFWGNIAALLQNNVKRMMAYSSIAHAGYVAIGLAAWGGEGRTAVQFYAFIYVFMNVAAFSVVLLTRKSSGFGEDVADLRGLARTSPLAAGSIVVVLLSLTGIPPTAGFMGKYLLLAAAVNKKLALLAVAGALNSVISLFYYFRVGKAMFMEGPEDGGVPAAPSRAVVAVLVLAALVLLALGILPSGLADLASRSVLN